jgi:hypothetical protein
MLTWTTIAVGSSTLSAASKRAIISSSSAPVRLESTWITLPAQQPS